MLKKVSLMLFVFSVFALQAQQGFVIDSRKDKITIPFKLINNLIFISLELNQVPMTFLLDSGVDETVLFGLEENREVELYNAEKISLKGLGNHDHVLALKSTGNKLTISKNYTDTNHTVLIILDQEINFSALVGIPVNGIVGHHFFENYIVEINYVKKRITLHKRTPKLLKSLQSYDAVPMTVESNKPYLYVDIETETEAKKAKLLIDTGNSDAVWIFHHLNNSFKVPTHNFDDFLGRGFSGEIHGKRAKIKSISVAGYRFENPYTTFPDSTSLKNVRLVKDRVGSIGGEILRRFHCVFDYKDQMIYIKRNSNYENPFLFNMSGLEIHHSGTQWVQETMNVKSNFVRAGDDSHYSFEPNVVKYKFDLKPTFIINSVRENSPAALAGLQKGDFVVKINNKYVRNMTLQKINDILMSGEGKRVFIEVERGGKTIKYDFVLKNIL